MIARKRTARATQQLRWLLKRTQDGGQAMSLGQLEDSRRPLLFSLLPRMLRRDGSTPKFLQGAFRYVDQRGDRAASGSVSNKRWGRALATSLRLARRRGAQDRDP